MKSLISTASLLLVFFLINTSPLIAQDPNFHIYLMFGQSNMEGQGPIEAQDRVTNPRVRLLQDQTCSNLNRTYGVWYTAAPPLVRCWGRVGPGDSFGKTMAENTPSTITIGIVNTSVGGCDIALFQKGAPIGRLIYPGGSQADIPTQFNGGYAWMLDLAKKAQTVGVIKGILFHQGETNTNDQNWKYKVQGIVADLKKDLGLGDIPFLAGELLYKSNGGPEQGCCSSHNTEINKLPGIIPNAYVISANGLKGQDGAHFTTAAYREFGIRYATKMLELISTTPTCTPTPIDAYSQINSDDWLQAGNITTCEGSQVKLGPHPTETVGWSWTGPNGFAATTREISLNALTKNQAGKYTAKYTNAQKCTSSLDFNIVVNTPTPLEPYLQINGGTWTSKTEAKVSEGDDLGIGPHPYDIPTGWLWTGPEGFTSSQREIRLSEIKTNQSGTYTVNFTNANGCTSSLDIPVAVNARPVINIMSPENNSVSSESVLISANVTDPDGNIILLEFLNGTQVIGTTNTAPYTFNWQNAPLGLHTITVRATDNNGGITTSSPVIVTVEMVTGQNKYYRAEATVSIHPNPSQNEIQIDSETDLTNATIKIMNAQGAEVNVPAVITGFKAKVDVSALTSGPYTILIMLDNAVLRKKVTVIR